MPPTYLQLSKPLCNEVDLKRVKLLCRPSGTTLISNGSIMHILNFLPLYKPNQARETVDLCDPR